MKYEKTINGIVDAVGGKDNIRNAYHCMTRLRLLLKDNKKADEAAVKNTEGVLGLQVTNGEYQIIIGPAVNSLYPEFIETVGLSAHEAIDENLDAAEKKGFSLKGVFDRILSAFSACITPIIPLLIVNGTLNLTAILLGPNFFKVIAAESALYTNLTYAANAIFYFLPMLLAYTASKHFKTNTMVTMAIAAFMLYPNYLAIVAAGEPYTFLGIPVKLIDYNTSVLPMMLIPWVQSYVEKLLDKIVPDAIKVIGVPVLDVLIMLVLGLCVLGPVATYLGTALNIVLRFLYDTVGPIETALVGAIAILGVALGFLRPIYFVGLMAFLETGVDYSVLPMLAVICNFTAMGATTAYLLKTKKAEKKQLAATCLLSNALGGVSEPSIYGIFIVNRICLATTAIGGAIAGLVQGLLKVGYFQRGTSNIFGVLSFVSADVPSNFTKGLIVCLIAFAATFALTFILYKDKENA